MSKIDFTHSQSAHCESGVTRNLLNFYGLPQITEPLSLGIGAGLFFVYLPFMKVNKGPVIAFRTMPGMIFKSTAKAHNIPIVSKTFSDKEKAKQYLDDTLAAGKPVGCQVGVYYLTYFPRQYRFHFNAHNIVVFGKDENGDYLISDPVMEEYVTLSPYELERVRFAKGVLAPKGRIYYPKSIPTISEETMRQAIKRGIKKNTFNMLSIPGPFSGINGIEYTAKNIRKWRDKLGLEKAGLYLAQLVRMQEEIGTGGGGFRFMYAAFLQEAHEYLQQDELLEISKKFTASGDMWRDAAVQAAGIYKGRIGKQEDFNKMSDYLMECAAIEKEAFKALSKIKWR